VTGPPPIHTEYLVAEDTARRMARLAVRYRFTRPEYLVVVGIEVVLGVLFLVTGPQWLGGVFLAAVALLLMIIPVQLRRLDQSLRARGFAPGTTVAVDFYPDRFVVTTPTAHVTHPLGDVRTRLVTPDGVALKMRTANILVLLPVELVAPEARPWLAPRARP
jgi:hypothetical protein